ncbi:hypothetical protein [Propionivibrio limicola]|uniref:hypothetical protein n=1 Tax=Propionivibrio limicola TaxID=167645 RepID=UPI0012924E93|nr:hypothetical protein [Propionivibrio limicola]
MFDFTTDSAGSPVSVPSEHGLLHGELALLPQAPGIVVLAHAGLSLDRREKILASVLRHAGLSTLNLDLLARQEEHFPDIHNNVPLLARRLLDFLGLLKHQMLLGGMELQPVGLFAANSTTPVVIRVAALRDHDIAAIVCRGGLIDLAGVLYLRSLESPLLLLHEESDAQHITSNRRALREIHGRKEIRTIPEIGFDYAISRGFAACAQEASSWFRTHFKNNLGQGECHDVQRTKGIQQGEEPPIQ